MLSLSLFLVVMIPGVLCSARRVEGELENHVGRFANPHRKALTSTPWGYSRFTLENIQPFDTMITTTLGPTTPANILVKDEEQHHEDDDDDNEGGEWEDSSSTSATTATSTITSPTQSTTTLIMTTDPSLATPPPDDDDEGGEWENSSSTSATTATSTISSPTQSTTTLITTTDPSLATPPPTATHASIETSTESPTHAVVATSAPSASLAASSSTYFASTIWVLESTTEHPTNNWSLTTAPILHFPTHSPTSADIVTSSPTTHFPTYFPTYSPTLIPQTSHPSTIKPTPFPSKDLIVSTSRPSPNVATYAPSISESSPPSTTPSIAPSAEFVTYSPSNAGSSVQSMAPIETFIVEGILTFQLNTNSLLTDNVATFESLAEDFLRRHLTIKLALDYNSEISLSSYDVTVASQTLVPHEQPSSTTISAEPLHVRMLEGPAILFLVTTVTAIGTPAELAADFPFQTAISIILLDNSDEFYGSLYTSGAFDGMQPPEHEHVELNGSDDGINKPLVFGSSIAGILVMLLLAGALFAMRSRHERKVEKAEKVVSCIAPSAGWVDRELDEEMGCKLSDSGVGFHMTETLHAALPFRDEEGNDLSSLDDSLSQDNPETISHEGSDLDASFNPDDNYSKIISHEDSDMSSDDSLRPEKNDRNISREDLSCLDSLNPGNYPQNVPHFPFSFDGDASMNISTDFDKQGDEWSYDDNYPLAQTENELKSYRMNQSYMTDSDDSSTTLSITSADLDGSLLSYVENASTVQTEQEGRSIQSYVGTVDGNALKLAGEIRK